MYITGSIKYDRDRGGKRKYPKQQQHIHGFPSLWKTAKDYFKPERLILAHSFRSWFSGSIVFSQGRDIMVKKNGMGRLLTSWCSGKREGGREKVNKPPSETCLQWPPFSRAAPSPNSPLSYELINGSVFRWGKLVASWSSHYLGTKSLTYLKGFQGVVCINSICHHASRTLLGTPNIFSLTFTTTVCDFTQIYVCH